ncbi:hypothetical protein [Paenibacillus woosongensis]|nr:hypothetical protein [Paenibacillus woosongensis]
MASLTGTMRQNLPAPGAAHAVNDRHAKPKARSTPLLPGAFPKHVLR